MAAIWTGLLGSASAHSPPPDLHPCPPASAGGQAALLRGAHRALGRALRPNALPLVDAFAYSDYQLNSALGRRDGNVYQALLDSARISPLNATPEGPAWKPVLEPLLNPRARSRM